MVARVIATAVAVTLLVGVSAPPLAAQEPVSPPPPTETGAPPAAQEPVPAVQSSTEPAPTTPPQPEVAPAAVAPVPAAAAPPTSPAPVAQQSAPMLPPSAGSSHSGRSDVYDVAGGVVTALKAPFNVALCALGGVLGLAIFAGTLGSGYRAATRTVEEGCSGPWVVTGDDLRPDHGRPATRLSDLHPAELEDR
jgi:hypothetical protein